jgi:aldehyde dehydrogenase
MIQGNPLDTETQVGAQASNDQLEKILSYFQIAAEEGARVIAGGERVDLGGDYRAGRDIWCPDAGRASRSRARPGSGS